jgi:hypothetical protein
MLFSFLIFVFISFPILELKAIIIHDKTTARFIEKTTPHGI